MKTRGRLLHDLLTLNGSIAELIEELSAFGFDAERPLIIAGRKDIAGVLLKCVDDAVSVEGIVEWANAIEIRDDIDFEDEELREFIFELANPEINGAVTKKRLLEIAASLDTE